MYWTAGKRKDLGTRLYSYNACALWLLVHLHFEILVVQNRVLEQLRIGPISPQLHQWSPQPGTVLPQSVSGANLWQSVKNICDQVWFIQLWWHSYSYYLMVPGEYIIDIYIPFVWRWWFSLLDGRKWNKSSTFWLRLCQNTWSIQVFEAKYGTVKA